MTQPFVYRNILGKPVHRYGISASYGLDEAGVREAIELGANYIFWSPVKKFLRTIIKDTVMKDRDRFLLATGPILGYFAGSVARLLGRTAIALLLCAGFGCSQYQRRSDPQIAPPQSPGDRCSEWIEPGRERPCPDGMKCSGGEYQRGKLVYPGRCRLEVGRCAVRDDCPPGEICVRSSQAIGYCGPAPGMPSGTRPPAGES